MAKSARQNNAQLQKLRAQQKQAERRRSIIIASVSAVVVLVIVGVVITAALLSPKAPQTAAATSGTVSDTLFKDVTSVRRAPSTPWVPGPRRAASSRTSTTASSPRRTASHG